MADCSRKLAFIIGQYKSGSTWLSNLLSLHPGAQGLAETHLFRYANNNLNGAVAELFDTGAWGRPKKSWLEWQLAGLTRPVRIALGHAKGHSTLSRHERPNTKLDLPFLRRRRWRRHL